MEESLLSPSSSGSQGKLEGRDVSNPTPSSKQSPMGLIQPGLEKLQGWRWHLAGQPREAMALLSHDQFTGAPEQGVSQNIHVPTTFLVGLLLPSSELGAGTRAP